MTIDRHGRSPLPAEIRDGMPHMAYYLPPLSFVWNGTIGDPIHVQHGGYGEPTIALIPTLTDTRTPQITSPHQALTWFRVMCDTWFLAWRHGKHREPYADDLVRAFERLDCADAVVENTGGNCQAVTVTERKPERAAEVFVTDGDANLPTYDGPGVMVTAARMEHDEHIERWLPGPPAVDVVAAVALHLMEQVATG